MALLTFDKSCWCYKRRKWKIRKAKALSLGKCEKALQVNVFSKHALNQLFLIKMLKPLLTHKSLDMSAGIPTFRAAELVPPFPWSSGARHSLPFTDAFLCKHGCQLKYTNKQQKKNNRGRHSLHKTFSDANPYADYQMLHKFTFPPSDPPSFVVPSFEP